MSQTEDFIKNYDDWRGTRLSELRDLINQTAPHLIENFKWGVPVWEYNGLVCAISAFKDHVKINFFKGAYLDSVKNVFNSGLDSKEHRSVNLSENDKLDSFDLQKVIKAAVDYNKS
ncbi:MAG: DUF1801 domain-containing protein [Candidatus Saccharimonadales bacterium]